MNLTDGLDGLAIGTTLIAAAAFTGLAYVSGHRVFSNYLDLLFQPGAGEVTVFCGAMVGRVHGLPVVELLSGPGLHGRRGQPRPGGALGTVALLIKQELLLFVVGGLFMIEAFSVMLQVGSFKLRGKRVFRMAPLHHHFELIGWKEPQIIIRFWIVAFVFALFSPHDAEAAVKPWSELESIEDPVGLERKPVVVVGLARSGVAAAALPRAARRRRSWPRTARRRASFRRRCSKLRAAGVRLELGGHAAATFAGAARSWCLPGVPWDLPELAAARAAGVPVIAEIELAFRAPRGHAWPRSPAPRASPRPPPPSARCCRRRAGTCGSAATSARPLIALVRGLDAGHRLRGRGLELPARGHRHASARTWRCS